jgi:hypothetical protein
MTPFGVLDDGIGYQNQEIDQTGTVWKEDLNRNNDFYT